MVMHARKPQRMNDGYFEKHQSHSYQSSKYSSSKREYERERSSNYRDRDISPLGGGPLNNGNSTSYRSQSPEIDSPSSRGHGSIHDIRDRGEHRGGGGGGGGGGSDRFSYIQKMRDRDRDVYKKDKYSEKRDRRGGGGGSSSNDRDSESHRTNHDRLDRRGGSNSGGGSKLCSSSMGDKHSGSDDRDRDRDRDRDIRDSKRERGSDRDRYRGERSGERERDRGGGNERSERGERVARCGDWSEHVSSSGKMYYYNCKTEVSQWEKPKEWMERERNLTRDQHREKDYRDKDRDRDREDRFSRSAAYTKHSSSRSNSRLRWNYDNDNGPPTHRRRLDGRLADNTDMDISPGDSTPTSEASYSLTGTPTTHAAVGVQHNDQSTIPSSIVGLPNALPRLASHPNTSSLSSTVTSASNLGSVAVGGSAIIPATSGLAGVSASTSVSALALNSNHRKLDSVSMLQQQSHLTASPSPNTTTTSSNQMDHQLNSNAPGPPKLSTKEQQDLLQQKVASLHVRSQPHHHHLSQHTADVHAVTGNITPAMDAANHALSSTGVSAAGVNILRDNPMNSPLYNLTHPHLMSPMSYTKSPITVAAGNSAGNVVSHTNNVGVIGSGIIGGVVGVPAAYSCNTTFGLKTAEGGSGAVVMGVSTSLCPSSSLANITAANNSSNVGIIPGEGPPTPTQELDISGAAMEQQQRKLVECSSSASLSTLQNCVASSVQAARSQGPEISPKLAKYFRADLITHVTNWPAEQLEKQVQKCSEEAHLYGDLQCTKVSAELKCARSIVRVTEITATLQEQKLLYLRQQIRRLEESKSQNSFMSDDL